MRRYNQTSRKKVHVITVIVLAVVLILAGITTLAYTQKWWPFADPDSHIIDGINYGPPTEDEVENSQNAKKNLLEEDEKSDEQDSGNPPTLKKVNIGVSHADIINENVEVRAFISGVVEGTGTCTATLTMSGAQTVVQSSKAFVDASTSQCKPIMIPISEFSETGEWTLVVDYESPTSQGKSEKITVNI